MSDERAEAIPERAIEAVVPLISGGSADWKRFRAKQILAAAAPFMAGSGEAERIAAWVREQAEDKNYGTACEWRNVADAIERESENTDWRCECGDLNRDHEAFCYRCGAGRPEDDREAAT